MLIDMSTMKEIRGFLAGIDTQIEREDDRL
jgi:hypothetical protein